MCRICSYKGRMTWERSVYVPDCGLWGSCAWSLLVLCPQGFLLSLFYRWGNEYCRGWAMWQRSLSWQQSWGSDPGLSPSLPEGVKLQKACRRWGLTLSSSDVIWQIRLWQDTGWITQVLHWGFWQFLNIELQRDVLIYLWMRQGRGSALIVNIPSKSES